MNGLSFDDAMDIADSMALPDGAFWAMSHELAGLEYGTGFPKLPRKKKATSRRQIKSELMNRPRDAAKPHRCGTCGKDFRTKGAKKRHRIDAHLAVVAA